MNKLVSDLDVEIRSVENMCQFQMIECFSTYCILGVDCMREKRIILNFSEKTVNPDDKTCIVESPFVSVFFKKGAVLVKVRKGSLRRF